MEKLVRDRIPEIIGRDQGKKARFRRASRKEYVELLAEKLREETGEYLADRNPAELADILEVVHQLARQYGIEPETLEEMRRRKAEKRGGFKERKVMDFSTSGY